MEMQTNVLWPRLSGAYADGLWEELKDLSVEELTKRAGFDHPSAVYAATGGRRVRHEEVRVLREQVVSVATELGWPASATQEQQAKFDLRAAGVLKRTMPIGAGEAARSEVWTFLCLTVMPDVVRWRFPDTLQRDRFFGSRRNTLQRLWWRAHLLEDPARPHAPLHLLQTLGEDVMVQLMERPGIVSDRQLALVTGQEMARVLEADPAGGNVRQLTRKLAMYIRQRLAIVCFDVMSAEQVRTDLRRWIENHEACPDELGTSSPDDGGSDIVPEQSASIERQKLGDVVGDPVEGEFIDWVCEGEDGHSCHSALRVPRLGKTFRARCRACGTTYRIRADGAVEVLAAT